MDRTDLILFMKISKLDFKADGTKLHDFYDKK